MANPITWRNISAPNFAGVQQGLNSAAKNITGGLDRLSNLAQDYGDDQHRVIQDTRDFNTNQFLNEVNSFKDLDGYGGFEQSMMNRLGGLNASDVDKTKILGQLDTRDNELMTDLTQTQTFQDAQTTRAERDPINQALGLAEQGRTKEAKELLYSSSVRNKGTIDGKIDAIADAEYNRQRGIQEDNITDDNRRQANLIPSLSRDVGINVDSEKDLTRAISKFALENEITGENLTAFSEQARKTFDVMNSLPDADKERLSNLQTKHDNELQQYLHSRKVDKEIDGNMGVLPEQHKAFSESVGAPEALDYINQNSGKESLVGDDDSMSIKGFVRGKYAGQRAKALIDVATESLIKEFGNTKDAIRIVRMLQGDGIPGSVIKKAFLSTPQEEKGKGGWHGEDFETALKETFRAYVRWTKNKNDSLVYDETTAKNLEAFRQEKLAHYNAKRDEAKQSMLDAKHGR